MLTDGTGLCRKHASVASGVSTGICQLALLALVVRLMAGWALCSMISIHLHGDNNGDSDHLHLGNIIVLQGKRGNGEEKK